MRGATLAVERALKRDQRNRPPVLANGAVLIEGRSLLFPGLTFTHAIGSGANATVFAAVDEQLNRRVAVKIWNARGRARSREETAKIARLSHPLFVTTHHFGMIGTNPFP